MMGRNATLRGLRRLLQALLIVLLLPTLIVSADDERQLGNTYLASRGYPNDALKAYGLGKEGNSIYTSLSWFTGQSGDSATARLAFASAANNLIKNADGSVDQDNDTVCQSELSGQLRGCYDVFVQNPLALEPNSIGNPVFITKVGTDVEGDALFPTLSRDGKYLVFQSGAEYTDYDNSSGLETDIFLVIFSDQDLLRVSAAQGVYKNDANFHSGNVDCAPVIYGVNHANPPACRTHPTGTAKPNFAHPHPVADATFISGQGVYVAFESMAELGANSNGFVKDIFVRQMTDLSGTPLPDFAHTLLTVGCGGQPANGDSYHPVFVPNTNGRYVVFVSRATNLDCSVNPNDYPPDDPNEPLHQRRANLFLADRNDGTIRLITKGTDGKPANRASEYPAVTYADGKLYIAFQSSAINLPISQSISRTQVFLYRADFDPNNGQLQNPQFQLISVRPDDSPAQGPSYHPAISADGRIISFTSYDDQLVEGDLNNSCQIQGLEGWTSQNCPDIFGRNWEADQTWRASLTASGQPPSLNSNFSSLSYNGRWVAFSSGSDMLSEGEAAAYQQVYVRDQGNPPGNPNIQPSFHDFGVVGYNTNPDKQFTVYFFGLNGGSVNVTGVDITLNKCADGSARDCFVVTENTCNGIRSDNSSCTFRVQYRAPNGEQPLQRGKVKFSYVQDATNLFLEVGLRAATPSYQPKVYEPEAQTVYYNGGADYRDLIVENLGNSPDTFNLQFTNNPNISLRVTDLQGNPLSQIGPLQPNEKRTLLLWTESKDWGQSQDEYVETATITLTSTQNPAKIASTNVETTSLLKRYGLEIETVAPENLGLDYNASGAFTFTVRNLGNIADSFTVSFADNEFSLWLDPADAPRLNNIAVGQEVSVKIWVRATQPNHEDHDIRVIFTSQGDPSKKDERTVRVTSGPAYIYLPLVRK